METDRIDDSMYNPQDDMYDPRANFPEPAMPSILPQVTSTTTPTKSFFDDMDKTTYLIIFIAFILGFFMGKTMQPVILRSS
jgi:hypothetical protein